MSGHEAREDQRSYYEQIGGAETVREAVDRFYALVLADEELAPYFVDADMPRLKRHQVLLLTTVLGGPDGYDGRELGEAHAGLGITEAHYRKVVHYLTGVLWNLGAGEDAVTAVGLTLASVEGQIVAPPAGGSSRTVTDW